MYTILYTIMVIKTLLTYGYYMYILYPPPLQLGGRCWTPRFSRGPQGQAPKKSLLNQCLLSRLGCYLLQNQEPSTGKKKPDKENSCFLQNQFPHM